MQDLSREVLSSSSSVSQGSSGDPILFCRVALTASSTPAFGRLTQGSQQQNSLLLVKTFCAELLQQLPVVSNLLWASLWKGKDPAPGACASSSSLFPLQLLLLLVPRDSRSRNALFNIVQSFLCHYSWLHQQAKMQGKVSREQYDVKCPTTLKIYC